MTKHLSKQQRVKRDESKIVLPITPMLDMTFQLLFFFIVSFNPADLEGAVELALPSEKQTAAPKDVTPEKPPELEDIKFESNLTVKVRTQTDPETVGEISAISILDNNAKEEYVQPSANAGRQNPLLVGLRENLIKRREMMSDNKESIKIQGDGRLKVARIIKVMDACREAGFNNISFVPPDDFRK
jgi:biopolymer transport protein ExbD